MLNYDDEAARYDETRGGIERAQAAASAVAGLVTPGRCLDIGGGTGIVSAELANAGLDVTVLDQSTGMLALAAERLPGRAICGDATSLPFANASFDVVTAVWLLHHFDTASCDRLIAEALRVLRPGGTFVTTVDKDAAHGKVGNGSDDRDRLATRGADLGYHEAGSATFSGRSQFGSATDGDPVFTVVAYRKTN